MKRITTRNALTAIEVLAATLLASLMLGSVVGLLGGLTRQQKALTASFAHPPWHDQLANQLQWDLLNSREFIAKADGIRLIGAGGRDFTNGESTGRPTAIDYFLLESGADNLLVRREIHLDSRTNDNWRTELVCHDVRRLEFGNSLVERSANGAPQFSPIDRANPVPTSVSIRVCERGAETPTFDHQFILR
jgi:hypothetical protein